MEVRAALVIYPIDLYYKYDNSDNVKGKSPKLGLYGPFKFITLHRPNLG